MKTGTEPRLSVPGLLCVWLLSSHRLRTSQTLREALYDCYHAWLTRSPDHVFDNAWQMLRIDDRERHPCIESLDFLKSELLVQRHQRWYIKPEAMGAWQQGLSSRMSHLPLMAWVGSSHLPAKPYSDIVEDYLSREGLHETHVHLNGSSHGEQAWLHALEHPLKSTKDFSKNFHQKSNKENAIRDLARNIDPTLTPVRLIHRLRKARKLRRLLMCAAFDTNWWAPAKIIDIEDAEAYPDRNSFCLKRELDWQTAFLDKCRDYPQHRVLPDMYHQYLLLMNQYYQLTVQNEQRVGFEQFQKHADAGLREHLERGYFERFNDVHGNNPRRSRVQFFEGRFAPKDEICKLQKLLLNILQGYHRYLSSLLPQESVLQNKRPPHRLPVLLSELDELTSALANSGIEPLQLALVCHFIKQPWSKTDIKYAPYRHHALIKSLRKKALVLMRLLKIYPKLKRWVCGIDGAANELHASPEFFAPVFRQCAAHGLNHKTFHAGEDFPHLLSGLRYMLEALEFLNLKAGDRLGHGTAMGIDPLLWMNRMPQTIIIKRGDWFLSLLAAWRLICKQPIGLDKVAQTLTAEIGIRSIELFGQHLNPYECEQAMGMRSLSLPELYRWVNNGRQIPVAHPVGKHWRKEIEDVHFKATANPTAFDIYWRWQSDKDLWKKSEEMIEVKSDFLQASNYLILQQALMHEVAERGVVIETLPSSNLRISQYKHFSEHHALRWMKAPSVSQLQLNDPDILVCLGSDDPGIFSTDIEAEFHHMFFALKHSGLNEDAALQRIAKVNERGRIYRFHPK